MRMIGPVVSSRGSGLQDHLCWVHGNPGDYCPRLTEPAGLTPFQVFACADGAVGLLGDFDVACQAAFERAMQRICPAPGDSRLVLDMSAVRYMDHRALRTLDASAQKCPVPVVVRSMPRIVRRVARVLGLEHLGGVHPGDSP